MKANEAKLEEAEEENKELRIKQDIEADQK